MKNKFIKYLLSIVFIVSGFFLAFVLNFALTPKIINTFYCYPRCDYWWDKIFDLFYKTSNYGYLEITWFNLIFTALIGVLFGIFVSYKIFWKNKKSWFKQ